MKKIIFYALATALMFGCNPEKPTPPPTANNSYVYNKVNTPIVWVGVENVEEIYTIYLAKTAPASAIAPITIEGLTITIPAAALGTNAVISSAGVSATLNGTALTGGTINATFSESTLTIDIKHSKVEGIAITANWNGSFTDVEPPVVEKVYVTITFESAELLTHTGGLYDYYDNILWAKPQATQIEDEDDIMFGSLWYDGILYTENIAHFGSFYTDYWGMYDVWGGFAISNTASMTNEGYSGYSGQFNVASEYASKFAGGYCSMNNGALYEDPTIILSEPKTFTSAEFTNTTITFLYADDAELQYSVIATGYLSGTQTGSVEIKLIENGAAKSGWETISLLELGEVDKIVFTANSNDSQCPVYFCMDNLKYEVTE